MKELWKKYNWIPITVFGSSVFALGFALFLSPNDMNSGGISGLAQVLVELLGFGSVGTLSILINLPLFLLGGLKIGKKFFAILIIQITAGVQIACQQIEPGGGRNNRYDPVVIIGELLRFVHPLTAAGGKPEKVVVTRRLAVIKTDNLFGSHRHKVGGTESEIFPHLRIFFPMARKTHIGYGNGIVFARQVFRAAGGTNKLRPVVIIFRIAGGEPRITDPDKAASPYFRSRQYHRTADITLISGSQHIGNQQQFRIIDFDFSH